LKGLPIREFSTGSPPERRLRFRASLRRRNVGT
jgi:hypothetical protein